MTPEQRAVKWFEKVPEVMIFHLTRDLLFAKTGIPASLSVVLFLLELILAYVLTDGLICIH